MNTPLKLSEAFFLRLFAGGLFGLIIAWLSQKGSGVSDLPLLKQVVIDTLMLGIFVVWAGASSMRRFSLLIWSLIAFALIAFTAWYANAYKISNISIVCFFIYPFLFIAHQLVSCGDQAGKLFAPYHLYFDQAWKHAVQLVLACLFTCFFWGILWLGAMLLEFIGFEWFKTIISNDYFTWIASGLAMGVAVQLGDVQANLLTYVRGLVLDILSWLLPVITIVGVIFAISLCFSGLTPLWNTKHATATLLSLCLLLIVLSNAGYQQGDTERSIPRLLKWCVCSAGILLLIFAILAAYSLYFRLQQYGFSPWRFIALIGVLISLLYGIGYCIATFLPGRWMHGIENTNLAMAVFNTLLFFAILTPLLDPVRLSVISQVTRLQKGVIATEKFDWKFLRFESGRFGQTALEQLIKIGNTEAIRATASTVRVAKDEDRYILQNKLLLEEQKREPRHFRVVFPKGSKIPDSFLNQKFKIEQALPNCLIKHSTCDVALIELNNDQHPEIIIYEKPHFYLFVKKETNWEGKNLFFVDDKDGTIEKAFKEGKLSVVKPEWNDLMIGDHRQIFK